MAAGPTAKLLNRIDAACDQFDNGKCRFLAFLEDEPIPIQTSFPQAPEPLARIVRVPCDLIRPSESTILGVPSR